MCTGGEWCGKRLGKELAQADLLCTNLSALDPAFLKTALLLCCCLALVCKSMTFLQNHRGRRFTAQWITSGFMCNGTLIDIKEPYSTMQLHEMLNILIFYIVFFFNAILQYNAFLSVPVKVFTCRVKLWQKMVCRFGFPETVWPLSSKRKPTLHDVRLSIICESTLLLKIEVSMIFFFYYYLLLFWNKVSCAHQGSIYWKSFSH